MFHAGHPRQREAMHFGVNKSVTKKSKCEPSSSAGRASLKAPLFDLLGRETGKDAAALAREVWIATLLLDKLGLYTVEVYQKNREAVKPAAAGRAE
jgi:hypothetical protein